MPEQLGNRTTTTTTTTKFKSHLPEQPNDITLDFTGTRMMEVTVKSSSQIVITNIPTPNFYRPDALLVTQPTVSEH